MKQEEIEAKLGIREDEAKFINERRDLGEVKTFCSLMSIQLKGYDEAGFVLLAAQLEDIRKVIRSIYLCGN